MNDNNSVEVAKQFLAGGEVFIYVRGREAWDCNFENPRRWHYWKKATQKEAQSEYFTAVSAEDLGEEFTAEQHPYHLCDYHEFTWVIKRICDKYNLNLGPKALRAQGVPERLISLLGY